MGDPTLRTVSWRSWTAILPALLLAGCATARSARAPEPAPGPLGPPAGEVHVLARDLAPGQPLVALGRWSGRLPPAAVARLVEGAAEAARARGLTQVRAATTTEGIAAAPIAPAAPAPAVVEPDGAVWGENVTTPSRPPTRAAQPEPRPRPLPGASWLEVTGLTLDQARLAEAPGGAALTLAVDAERTDAPAAPGAPLRTTVLRFTLLDEASGPALLTVLESPGEAEVPAMEEAVARLLARAAARLAAGLVLPGAYAGAAAEAPSAIVTPPGDEAPATAPRAPVEATYVARRWMGQRQVPDTARGMGEGFVKGGEAGSKIGYGGLLCGPLAPACMMALGLAGGAAGGVLGALGGAANPPLHSVPAEQVAALPPEPVRLALLEALRRRAAALSLAEAVEATVHRELEVAPARAVGALPHVARIEVRLTADEGADHPARLALVVTAAAPAGQAAAAPLVQETPDALPALTWLDDDGAVLGLVLERAAVLAGRTLAAQVRQAAAPSPAPGGGDSVAVRP